MRVLVSALALALAFTSPAAADVILPANVQLALQSAALKGPNQLLAAVYNSTMAYPGFSEEIIHQALQYQPSLYPQITAAAQNGTKAGVQFTTEAASLRAAGTTAGVSSNAWWSLGLGLAAVGGGAAALAGGGGGGGGGGTLGAFDAEYAANYGLDMVNADSAYARGATGAGVLVAVIDSGYDTDHPEFIGQIDPDSDIFTTNTTDTTVEDGFGHGTFVSGILAARRNGVGIHGVAYEADMLELKLFDAAEVSGFSSDFIAATNFAVAQGAQIINGSYGFDGSFDVNALQNEFDAYRNAINAGTIMVFAAGNEGDPNPGAPALMPYIEPAHNGSGLYTNNFANRDYSLTALGLVAVVSVDENGTISSFSNRCGVAAAWCLAAPGGDIYSTFPDKTYATGGGTSFAAPHVSGALALLIDLYPSLTPAQIVNRLLTTATKSGVYANTSIYGQGLLNLQAATVFVGTPFVPVGPHLSGTNYQLSGSRVHLGAAFGDGLSHSLAGVDIKAVDSFDGAMIGVDAGTLVNRAKDRNRMEFGLSRFGLSEKIQKLGLGDAATLSMREVPEDRTVNGPGQSSSDTRTEARLEMNFSADTKMSLGYMDDPAMGFGLMAGRDVSPFEMRSDGAFLSPYLGFAKDGMNAAVSTVAPGGTIRAGSFFSASDEDEQTDAQSFGAVVEYDAQLGEGSHVAVQTGMLSESGTFLGSESSGAFASAGTNTVFGGLSTKVALTDDTDMVGTYFLGFTTAKAGDNSLFTGFSDLQSDAFSLGVVKKDIIDEGDRFGVMLNQPLRISGGTAGLRLPSGGDVNGNVFYSPVTADLTPTGREIDLEAFYGTALDEKSSLNASLMWRHQPNHVAEADDEGQMLVRWQRKLGQ